MVFKSKKGSADYHEEMNATSFEEWFKEKLLPALPPNTLIVMDNPSYHRYLEILPKFLFIALVYKSLFGKTTCAKIVESRAKGMVR